MCSDCLIETLVNALTFSNTWNSISLFMGLTLIDFLIKNKSLNKEGLFIASFF